MKIKFLVLTIILGFIKIEAQNHMDNDSIVKRKPQDIGIKFSLYGLFSPIDSTINLEYEIILKNNFSFGFSVSLTSFFFWGEEILPEEEDDAAFTIGKYKHDFIIIPYIRYYLSPSSRSSRLAGTGFFLEPNLFFGYYPYKIKRLVSGRPIIVEDYTNFSDALNIGAGGAIGFKTMPTKDMGGFFLEILLGFGIYKSTSKTSAPPPLLNIRTYLRSGFKLGKRF